MNINNINDALARANDSLLDGISTQSASGNTTVGGGTFPTGSEGVIGLVVTQAATQEERTLGDPEVVGINLLLVLYSTAGAQVQITASSKINVAGNTRILLTAVDQSIWLRSMPFSGNTNLARWQIVYNNGASLS